MYYWLKLLDPDVVALFPEEEKKVSALCYEVLIWHDLFLVSSSYLLLLMSLSECVFVELCIDSMPYAVFWSLNFPCYSSRLRLNLWSINIIVYSVSVKVVELQNHKLLLTVDLGRLQWNKIDYTHILAMYFLHFFWIILLTFLRYVLEF